MSEIRLPTRDEAKAIIEDAYMGKLPISEAEVLAYRIAYKDALCAVAERMEKTLEVINSRQRSDNEAEMSFGRANMNMLAEIQAVLGTGLDSRIRHSKDLPETSWD